MIYININGAQHPAKVLTYGKDPNWGGRESKHITLEMTHGEAASLFVDGLQWSVIQERGSYKSKDGETVTLSPIETDCSAYDVAGSITDNRDGTVTVRMGKSTPAEVLSAVAGVSGTMKLAEAKAVRSAIETAAENLDDQTASTVPGLFRGMKYDGLLIEAGTRINWGGTVKRAAADLWDTAENSPENAPDLWEDIQYRAGIRIIPETITVVLAFSDGEKGWWGDVVYVSKVDANVYTPEEYPDNWEVAE